MTAPATPLSLGFSTCPNDTFIFHALVHRLVPGSPAVTERLEDVETLNRLVLDGALDVSKVSFHLLAHVRENYALLRSGAALGRGCGPLLVARRGTPLHLPRGAKIAVPGRYTTAFLLLRLFDPGLGDFLFLPFDRIMPAVASGEADAGLIIHESRFTFPEYGLVKLLDLGSWWEEETGAPIPLGGIVAKRSLGREMLLLLERSIRSSLEHAYAHPEAASSYIRRHAQEMSDEVCAAHIGLYVNPFSLELGDEGTGAVETLMRRAEAAGIAPPFSGSFLA